MTVTSPLSVSILPEASLSVGAAALEAEVRKHRANDPKCSELEWVCIGCMFIKNKIKINNPVRASIPIPVFTCIEEVF